MNNNPVENIEKAFMKVGDKVTWTSQAGGWSKTKVGIVIEVVPAGVRPEVPVQYLNSKTKQFGGARKVESYLVVVGKQLYWPLPGLLQPVRETQEAVPA